MRLWHQSLTVLTDLPGYTATLRRRIDDVVRSDTSVVLHGFAPGSFPANYPGPDIAHNYLYQLHAHQFVAAALEAEAEGFDAMVLASLPSPMIEEIRSLMEIPVVGYGDTAFRMAGLFGRRFGLLLFNVERLEFWPHRIEALGVERAFGGVRPSGVTFAEVAAAHGDPEAAAKVIARVVASAERMVAELNVDVLIPGEMPLNVLLAEAGISQIAGATVMDGLACAFKTAEMLVELRRGSGMQASRRGYFHSAPDKQRVRAALDFYGIGALGAKLSTGQ
jgi:Asp/Glu/hydantoin racemase